MTRRQSLAKRNHGKRTTNGAPGTEPGCSPWVCARKDDIRDGSIMSPNHVTKGRSREKAST
ncbi:hypothetical protein BDV09DRAFT_171720 [Aspergillus tetrazonus]